MAKNDDGKSGDQGSQAAGGTGTGTETGAQGAAAAGTETGTAAGTETGTGTATGGSDLAAELEKWKALSRQNEERAKANAEKAKKLDELEKANMSELEKAQAELAELKKENESLKGSSLRNEVAAAKGVPANLISGSTKEELEAAADALIAFKGGTATAPSSDGQGNNGTQVSTTEDKTTAEDVVKAALGR